jgi:hypothetical protein
VRILLARGALILLVLAGATGSLLLLDRVNPPPARLDPGTASIDTTNRSRLLMLQIDSWRYETAIDSTMMPRVAALRKQGASWKVETVFEGFTVPALRAAFSGHAETQLVNLIQNFQFKDLGVESFFQDAKRLGKRTLVVAVEGFRQFGPYFEIAVVEDPRLDMYALDRVRAERAVSALRDDTLDIVVGQYESTDWVAHEDGVQSDRYRAEFRHADSLVAAFAAARRPNDYVLIFGDHGHSATGEHKTGIYIPTFALLLGPDVRPGVTTAPMAIANLRYVVSHAIGISLRTAPYDMENIRQFLPVQEDLGPRASAPERGMSRRVSDFVFALAVAAGALALAWLVASGFPGAADAKASGVVMLVLIAELSAQRELGGAVSLFPLLLIGLGVASPSMSAKARAAVIAVGAYFVLRIAGVSFAAAPAGFGVVIPLYVFAIGAKLLLFDAVLGRARWRAAVAWTAATTLVELRVWDSPLAGAALLVAGIVAFVRAGDESARRAGAMAQLCALVYFTLRAPLYHLAWIDLFLLAVWIVARRRDDVWTDALIITGAFTLTSGWLDSGLEWGFLYTIFPSHLVEFEVQYFVPLILAKLPLLLVLAMTVAGRLPSRRFAIVLLAYAAFRFAGAWLMRMGGASGADIWPMAEQGMYVTAFVMAVLGWRWRFPQRRVSYA